VIQYLKVHTGEGESCSLLAYYVWLLWVLITEISSTRLKKFTIVIFYIIEGASFVFPLLNEDEYTS
jgi:hypothetical protein